MVLRVRVRRVGGMKSRREGRSTPGPGLVVVDGRTSKGRPGKTEGCWRLRSNKNLWTFSSSKQSGLTSKMSNTNLSK